ncbi:MAG: ferrochelatase [Deltaproteobacteria bacterium]|jgi:hypothetical protein|nr:ferrochelatase [Deltaproteobacteria bacterium]MBT6434917.1 ferrochelatase [Deltaproteobacteria bacterium]MBT6490420.1 ferrochelatase [Deltaproteobacteria bacterium]
MISPTAAIQKHRDRLSYVQLRVEDKAQTYLSLSPTRETPTTLPALLDLLAPRLPDPDALEAFVDGLDEIAESILANFPDNIFWDLDYLAGALTRAGSPRQIRLMTAMVVDLQRGFGRHSILAFRYVHDFTLGFDWCRWVKEDVQVRQETGPFDWVFLLYLQKRRRELEALIAENDEKYRQLKPGEIRNPFVFSREPDEERLLHEALSQAGDIPVVSWEVDGLCQFEKRYGEARVAAAQSLNIPSRVVQNA